jgi:hypothetical protein
VSIALGGISFCFPLSSNSAWLGSLQSPSAACGIYISLLPGSSWLLFWVSAKLPSFVFVFWSCISEFCQLQNTKTPNGFFAAIPEEIFLWSFDLLNSAGEKKREVAEFTLRMSSKNQLPLLFLFLGGFWIVFCAMGHREMLARILI